MANQVLQLGSSTFTIQKMPNIITSRDMWLEMNKRKDITTRDADAVRELCEACSEVGVMVATSRGVKFGRTTQSNVQLMGITENYPRIGSVRDLISGRHLVDEDVENGRAVAVIGADLMDAFFGEREPLGKVISLDNHELRVVGVAERKGKIFG